MQSDERLPRMPENAAEMYLQFTAVRVIKYATVIGAACLSGVFQSRLQTFLHILCAAYSLIL